jgi:hypothetical protein
VQDEEGVVEYRLDTLTQATRFVAGVAPNAVTRLGLGVVLAVHDAANDPAGELLGAKLTEGASAIVSTISTIARASGSKVRSSVVRLSASDGKLRNVPGFNEAKGFVTQAASEVKGAWSAAGHSRRPKG